MKRLIIILLLIFAVMTVTGCSNRYPNVQIDTHAFESVLEIDIGNKYEYVDYDVITTDSGKDIVIHFDLREGKTDEQIDKS